MKRWFAWYPVKLYRRCKIAWLRYVYIYDCGEYGKYYYDNKEMKP